MRPALQLRLGQQLSLTPQLKQAIKLLALSNLELGTELSQLLESNPILELESEPVEFPETAESAAELVAKNVDPNEFEAQPLAHQDEHLAPANTTEGEDAVVERLPDTSDDRDLDLSDGSLRDWGSPGSGDEEDDDSYESRVQAECSLREHLHWQLELMPFTPRDRAIADVLVDSVEDDGYLREPIDFQRAALAPEWIVEDDEIEAVRHRLMRQDPPGVLSRTLIECLVVQLEQITHPRRTLAIDLVLGGMEQIARSDRERLAKIHEVEPSEVAEALKLIRDLNPRPGSGFSAATTQYVIPDVQVRKRNDRWEVRLNAEAMPRLRICSAYERLIGRAKREDATYLRGQLQDAKQLLKSLAQREDTVLRVARAIVKEQEGFFEHGPERMRPLVLRQIAEQCELHESTVSRVTTRKYMHTPRGLFEFKHFFSSGVATRDGGEASATAIQQMIRRLVDTEEAGKPLSDNALMELLKARGVLVARRTVAKYREGMGIPASTDRVRP